jgi:hypothetical protein
MVPSAATVMPRGLSRPVATLVHAVGRPEGDALGVWLAAVEGSDDGLETALLGVALEAGALADGLADGPAQATNRRAKVATTATADRAPIAAL